MQITTERLILREFQERDWRDILRYQLDPEYLRFYAWEGRDEEDVHAFVDMFVGWRDEVCGRGRRRRRSRTASLTRATRDRATRDRAGVVREVA